MCWPTRFPVLLAPAALLLAAFALPEYAQAARPNGPPDDFQPFRSHVLRYFAGLPNYQPGDLITQSQVKPLLAQLVNLGFPLTDPEALLARVSPDGSFLARELRTRQGRDFMRYLSGTPEAFARMERVARMKRGQQTVRDLVARGRKGADVFDYFAGTSDGKKAGKLMARRGQASGFNKQTEKLYTVDQLLAELNKMLPSSKAGNTAKTAPVRVKNTRMTP